MKKLLILWLAWGMTFGGVQAQQRYTISGYITDGKSNETLINATLLDLISGEGTVSNTYGFYSITLAAGDVKLRTSYVGYENLEVAFRLERDTALSLSLKTITELQEVTIVGNRLDLGVKGSQMSAVDIPIEQIKAVPAMFGETDVLKALQLLPGVQSGTEGSAGLYVRGGSPDENLLLLDGVPVYNVNHLFGFFSVFNPDAIKNVTLYKGSFPAHYAGRLSSVVDIRMKEGDMYRYHGNVNVSPISSKINVEGPILKGKTSFNLSARRTYSDLFTNLALWYQNTLEGNATDSRAGYYFYDLNLKVNHKFSDRDRLYLSCYTGDDGIYFSIKESDSQYYTTKSKLGWKWGNRVTAARWNHVINPKLFMDASLNYTQYRHRMSIGVKETDKELQTSTHVNLLMKSGIYDKTGKVELHYAPVPTHDIRLGASYTHHLFRPDVMTFTANTDGKKDNQRVGQKDIYAHETQLYVEDNVTINSFWKANVGLNYATFSVNGRFYNSLQPRVSNRLLLTDDLSLKAGYAYMSQYVHLLSNSSISLPTDLWVPVTERIEPENAHQFAAGVFYNLLDWADLSVEGYYKRQNNLLEYRDGASFMTSSTNWEDKVAMGRGWSYGVEFLAQRSVGQLTGWVAYTWSKTQRQFDRKGQVINQGKPFCAKYDRRHDISITGNYKFSKRFDFSATWVYATGNCGTVYTQYYEKDATESGYDGEQVGYFGERNNYRLEPYHRLDLSFNFRRDFKRFQGVSRLINISVYNAYCNMNPFMVFVYSEYNIETQKTEKKLQKVTIFPLIPTLSYGISF